MNQRGSDRVEGRRIQRSVPSTESDAQLRIHLLG